MACLWDGNRTAPMVFPLESISNPVPVHEPERGVAVQFRHGDTNGGGHQEVVGVQPREDIPRAMANPLAIASVCPRSGSLVHRVSVRS